APDLVLVVEIADPGIAIDKAETLALELEALRQRPPVADRDAMGFVAAALALVASARIGHLRHQLLAGIGEINQARLDRIGRGVELGNIGHHGSSATHPSDDKEARPPLQPPRAQLFTTEAQRPQRTSSSIL